MLPILWENVDAEIVRRVSVCKQMLGKVFQAEGGQLPSSCSQTLMLSKE